jgi:DNA-binding CsgD family transcriptional regulator/PAS domain-containing protein
MRGQHHTEEALSLAIAAIYDAAVTTDRWPVALERLRELFGLAFVASIVRGAAVTEAKGVAVGVDHDDYQQFLRTYFRGSIFFKRDKSWHVGQITLSSNLVPDAVFHRTQMYREYWRPREMHEGLRLAVSRDESGLQHTVNLVRSPSRSEFTEADLTLAQLLMPHLQAADRLTQRVGGADMLASAAFSALDTLHHAVFFLDRYGRTLHCNAAGEALLQRGDRLVSRRGLLHAATAAETNRLVAMLARAAGTGGPPVAGTLRLTRGIRGGGLALLAMPFRQEPSWSLAQAPAVLLCVTDLDAITAPAGWQIAELFGLTGAERVLACDLMAGLELRDIAERRGRSINTVRTHLARLTGKTYVTRQSELMRLLFTLPRAFGPAPGRSGLITTPPRRNDPPSSKK